MHHTTRETEASIGPYTFDEYIEAASRFHGYAAPGLILGGFMVAEAMRRLPEDILFDAVAETAWCLPDAVQMLTPCTVGNGWLKIVNLGLYAVSLYDKHNGQGVRVAVDARKLERYPTMREWLLKTKPKKEQDSDRLRQEMREAGHSVCTVQPVTLKPEALSKRSKGRIAVCSLCAQAYPARDGAVCRSCQGEAPYLGFTPGEQQRQVFPEEPPLRMIKTQEAAGKSLLHDMTAITPGESKEAVFLKKQKLDAGDVCRLHKMGRFHVYTQEDQDLDEAWVHEDEAARAMAAALAGNGVRPKGDVREGKVTLCAEHDGLLVVDIQALREFNMVPGVMAACRQGYSLVTEGQDLAATRAIPLFLPRQNLQQALDSLAAGPALKVARLRPRKTGILVTGTEVFQGLVQDRFAPIVQAKVEALGCKVVACEVAPDDCQAIAAAVQGMLDQGVELLVTTAGLSVDPEDVTRKGLEDAGVQNMLYGMPVLPGAMTLLARAGAACVIGVPACALYYKTTSFDILLPRILADIPISREDLAELGHGAYCHNCKNCTYPKCAFAK